MPAQVLSFAVEPVGLAEAATAILAERGWPGPAGGSTP
jgi:hypothetical protein